MEQLEEMSRDILDVEGKINTHEQVCALRYHRIDEKLGDLSKSIEAIQSNIKVIVLMLLGGFGTILLKMVME